MLTFKTLIILIVILQPPGRTETQTVRMIAPSAEHCQLALNKADALFAPATVLKADCVKYTPVQR